MKNKRWASVVLWSVISAAFIGPGTVTTAVKAGSDYRLDLLWAVTFAMVSCIIVQEVAARITIASGMNLGQLLVAKFGRKGKWLQYTLGSIVIFGCAAYQAGNVMGAVAGIEMIAPIGTRFIAVLVVLAASVSLWVGRLQGISWFMTALVGIMGISFFMLCFSTTVGLTETLPALVMPSMPAGAEFVAIGLIGTTIVPYNIFLGSGISKGQTIPLMRLGLTVSVLIGGFITAVILISGTMVDDFSTFKDLAIIFENKMGTYAVLALAFGLFAAGFSSAITSPYAASVIATTVFGWSNQNKVRAVWITVLLCGFIFSITGLPPIPVILTAQALNGFILPLMMFFLIVILNDKTIIPQEHRPGIIYNTILVLIFLGVLSVGLNNIYKVIMAL